MRPVKCFYKDSRACVRVGRGESDWFEVNVGLRQGCVMSPWLFNVYMDGIVREVNARVQGKCLVRLGEDGGAKVKLGAYADAARSLSAHLRDIGP